MSNREPFGIGLQNLPVPYNSDGPSFYQPVGVTSSTQAGPFVTSSPVAGNGVVSDAGGEQVGLGSGNMGGSGINMNSTISEPMKRKRGRPRKYGPGPDATMALGLTPTPSTAAVSQSSGGYSAPIPPSASSTSFKKRGRPLGSGKKHQMEASGSLGIGFTPHVITVMAGEDVSSKIMSFSQQGTKAICVLSANGAISNVTLRQAATSGGSVTYEGRFEILSLSGSFLLSENGGARSRTGGLSVSLSGPDGRLLGGSVAGLLTAASPVQVIVGSFNTDGRKESKSRHQMDPLFAQPKLAAAGGTIGANSPPSRGTLSESSGGPGSPLNQTTEACNNSNPHGMSSMPWK